MENMILVIFAVLWLLTWVAMAAVVFWFWKRTHELQTSVDNAVMLIGATEKEIRRDMKVDEDVVIARFTEVGRRIADLEPARPPAPSKVDPDEKVTQFSTGRGFRSFMEGNNQ